MRESSRTGNAANSAGGSSGGGVIHRRRIACQAKGAGDHDGRRRPRSAALFTALAIEAATAILRFDCRSVAARAKGRQVAGDGGRRGGRGYDPGGPCRRICPACRSYRRRRPRDAATAATTSWSIRSTAPREFLAGRDEFTVNIALVRDGAPVARRSWRRPRWGSLWRGASADGRAAARSMPARRRGRAVTAIRTRPWPAERGRGGQPLAFRRGDARRSWRASRRSTTHSPAARR